MEIEPKFVKGAMRLVPVVALFASTLAGEAEAQNTTQTPDKTSTPTPTLEPTKTPTLTLTATLEKLGLTLTPTKTVEPTNGRVCAAELSGCWVTQTPNETRSTATVVTVTPTATKTPTPETRPTGTPTPIRASGAEVRANTVSQPPAQTLDFDPSPTMHKNWEVRHGTSGLEPNDSTTHNDTVIELITQGGNTIENYDQVQRSLLPGASSGVGTGVVIYGVDVDVAANRGYWAIAEMFGNTQYVHVAVLIDLTTTNPNPGWGYQFSPKILLPENGFWPRGGATGIDSVQAFGVVKSGGTTAVNFTIAGSINTSENGNYSCDVTNIVANPNSVICSKDGVFPSPTPSATPTPTPTGTATPTPEITTLQGTVFYQGRTQGTSAYESSLDVKVFQAGTSNLIKSETVTTNNSGQFSVSGIPMGSYDIVVKHPQYLSQRINSSASSSGVRAVNFGQLRAGDANDDDLINLPDFSLVRADFGKTTSCASAINISSQTTSNCADFDSNGKVDVRDFSLLRSNFGQFGSYTTSTSLIWVWYNP